MVCSHDAQFRLFGIERAASSSARASSTFRSRLLLLISCFYQGSSLKAEMRHPEVIAEYVRTYHEERNSTVSRRSSIGSSVVAWLGNTGSA